VLLPGAIVEGEYRIDRVIAQGGMGVVFAATHLVTNRKATVDHLAQLLRDHFAPRGTAA
jgi:hypothetical protein